MRENKKTIIKLDLLLVKQWSCNLNYNTKTNLFS